MGREKREGESKVREEGRWEGESEVVRKKGKERWSETGSEGERTRGDWGNGNKTEGGKEGRKKGRREGGRRVKVREKGER